MLKAGMLPAPVIQPLRYDTIGTRIKVGPNTYIQIRSEVPASKIYFTTDGTKPDPFQVGKTGKWSTHKYIGPFRLQIGNRVVKAIVVSRDRLRESPISTRFIDVTPNYQPPTNLSDRDVNDESSYSDEEQSEYMNKFPANRRNSEIAELQGSVEGPINPVNYSGTQINVWGGFPSPELANFLAPKPPPQPQLGFLTDQMIKNLNTPRPAIEQKPISNEFSNLPENLKKFFKQVQKLYERDTDFQNNLDYIIENGQLKMAEITQTPASFEISMNFPKFLIDEPVRKPVPPPPKKKPVPPRPISPDVEIFEETKPLVREPSPPPPPPPKPIPKPVIKPVPLKEEPPKKEPPPPTMPEGPSTYVEENQQQGTMVDAPNFNAENDAEQLRGAVKGLGTKEEVIIKIVGNRSNAQRLRIKDTYKAMFGRDLVEDLKGDTSGNFKKLLVGLFLSPVEYDCMELRKAIQGLGTDDSALIEILTSRSNKRLKDIAKLYQELYKKKMEDDVSSDTSGAYKKIITSILSFGRPETNEVDLNLVRQDVDDLVKAGIKKWGTDESKFNVVFGSRSYAHLRQMFEEYQRVTKKTMEDSIKSEMSGNLAKTYLALISNIRDKPSYFAKEIKKSIKGMGTDEHTLNRIIISRCEIDMIQIKNEYVKIFNTTMEKDVGGDVSGDYGKLLLMLIKDPSERTYEGSSVPEEPHEIETVEEPVIVQTPTVTDFAGFNASSDSDRLRKAMKGIGTDEKTIIEIIPRRSNKQRQELKTAFKSMFGRDLVQDLHSELSGHFRDAIEALMMMPDEFDAFSFRKAIKGLGTDDSALIELLTTRTPEQINEIKAKYKTMYNRELEADIKSDTSGHYRNVLISLLTASRPSGNTIDKTQARIDCDALIKAGVKKWGTDEAKFVTILCTRSYSQLRGMFQEYQSMSGHSLEDDIKKECSGDLQKIFLAIVSCVKDRQAYFAELMYKAMKGLGTKESTLIRVMTSRSEVDMVQIKEKFQQSYKSSLRDFLKGDVSGDFLKTLLPLIGEY